MSGAENEKPSLTVKNLAKLQQKTSSSEIMRGQMLDKYNNKKAEMASAASAAAGGDEALWYWLKSQQAMMGLNSLYNQSQMPPRASSPKLSSPMQPTGTSQTPTPEISSPVPPHQSHSPPPLDDKNGAAAQGSSAWFWQWYKTFGASLMGDKNAAAKMPSLPGVSGGSGSENILYSQLTKGASASPTSNGNINNNTINNNFNIPTNESENGSATPKPEDLSNHPEEGSGPNGYHDEDSINNISPIPEEDHSHQSDHEETAKKLEMLRSTSPDDASSDVINDSNNNNKNGDDIKSPSEALEYGEKFLKYLESYSDPSLTAMQVMQFRYLLNSIKMSVERAQNNVSGSSSGASSSADGDKSRHRRRK